MSNTQTKPVKKPLNIVTSINQDINDNNVICPHENSSWKLNSNPIRLDELSIFLWTYRAANGLPEITKDKINNILLSKEYDVKAKNLSNFKDLIRYNPLAKDSCDDIIKILTHTNYHLMYPIVLKHIVWTVKRRLYDLPVYCPIFLNIYGSAGSGKSEFVKAMFSIFPATLKSQVSNAADLFNDERQAFRFVESYVISMDELTGLNKTDMNKLKNQIDAEKIVYRMLGFNKLAEGKNNAQLIGTSNTRLQNTLFTDSDLRKWCEIDIFKYEDKEVPEKLVTPLQKYDWLNFWQAIDENAKSPFEDSEIYNAFRRWTEERCLTETPTVEFIKNYIEKNGNAFKTMDEIWEAYTGQVDDKAMSKSKLKELIEKYGFVKHRITKGRGYNVPNISQCKYFSEEDQLHYKSTANKVESLNNNW
jgi:hypothetical protein